MKEPQSTSITWDAKIKQESERIREYGYAHGWSSYVFRLTPAEKEEFPEADLVKEVETNDATWYQRLYLRHKIANTLFPDNFIGVVGCDVEPHLNDLFQPNKFAKFGLGSSSRIHKLYSKLAPVNPDHVTFSHHLTGERLKESWCSCEICSRHKPIHHSHKAEQMVKDLVGKTEPYGIDLPIDDPSDYCLTDQEIIFFELTGFDHGRLRLQLSSIPQLRALTEAEKEALALIQEYEKQLEIAKIHQLRGRQLDFTVDLWT